jgi:hypothetical protein
LPTSTDRRAGAALPRLRVRRGSSRVAGLLGAAIGMALLCSCSGEAQVTHPTAQASATPILLTTLPPIGFNHRYGNNPVSAADAFAMERKLFAQKQYWEVGLRADPADAGYVDAANAAATSAARGRFNNLLMIIASESLPTLRGLLLTGDSGQQQYCQGLVDQVRTQGYSGLQKITLVVFFGESDRHAELDWSPSAGYSFKILDNNLNGALLTPVPTATPFATPPPH